MRAFLPARLVARLPASLPTLLCACLNICMPTFSPDCLVSCLSVLLPACLSRCLPACLSCHWHVCLVSGRVTCLTLHLPATPLLSLDCSASTSDRRISSSKCHWRRGSLRFCRFAPGSLTPSPPIGLAAPAPHLPWRRRTAYPQPALFVYLTLSPTGPPPLPPDRAAPPLRHEGPP